VLLDEALERASLGISSRGKVLSDEERKRVAYHEAGHALAAGSLPGGTIPHRVSVIPRGRSLGASWLVESRERLVLSRSELIDQMSVLLAGRAAEEIVYGESGTAAADDLRRVAELARQMVVELGMGGSLGAQSFSNGHLPYSQQTLERIDAEVSKLVAEGMERSLDTLRGKRNALDRVAGALAEQETLDAAEIRALTQA
jgi:cell division protease FtsH